MKDSWKSWAAPEEAKDKAEAEEAPADSLAEMADEYAQEDVSEEE